MYMACSVALAILAILMLNRYVREVSAGSISGGPETRVIVAALPIARGTQVLASDLEVRLVPRRFVQPGALMNVAQAAGRVALTDIRTGETVTDARLARVRAGPVASLVPEGLRAFAVPTSLPPGAVAAGDRVDVLATFSAGQPHTETVVEGVEILAVLAPGGSGRSDLALDAAGSGAVTSMTLLVLVSPEQENDLAFARAFANLEVIIGSAEERT